MHSKLMPFRPIFRVEETSMGGQPVCSSGHGVLLALSNSASSAERRLPKARLGRAVA